MRAATFIIVDDEPTARVVLESHAATIDTLQGEGSFHDPVEAYLFLQKNPVDIIFLDINMPRLSGLELAKNIPATSALIFTTAYSEHALQGFDRGAIDYLVKPVSFERFLTAVSKALQFVGKNIGVIVDKRQYGFFLTKVNGLSKQIPVFDIYYVQSFGNFLKIYSKDKMMLATETIKSAEEKLNSEGFIRCHRSYLVNKEHIGDLGEKIVLTNNVSIPIGYLYRREVERSLS